MLCAEIVSALLYLIPVDAYGQILGHVTRLDGVNDCGLKSVRELAEELVAVQLCSVAETSGPCEDGGDGVGGGGLSLLPLSVVAGDGTVGGLSLHDVVLVEEDRGHETQGPETLRDDVRLHIPIVVLAGPNDSTVSLDNLGDHVVNESVLVVDALLFELCLVFLYI